MPFPALGRSYPKPLVNFAAGTYTTGNLQTFNFTGVALGAAAADRVSVVGFFLQGSPATTIANLLINGITAAIATQVVNAGETAGFGLAVIGATTAANIALTSATTQTGGKAGVVVYSVVGYQLNTTVAYKSATAFSTSTTTVGVSQNVPVNGAALAIVGGVTVSGAATSTLAFSSPPNDYSAFIAFNVPFAAAHLNLANRVQGFTATCGTAFSANNSVMAALSLG